MNNKKGFTLVELLAVIAIILFLLLIVSPKIISTINNSRNKGYYEIERRIEEAAAKYIATEHIDSNMNSITISKSQLIDSGYLGEIYDLKDNSICDASVVVNNLKGLANFKVALNCSSYLTEGYFVELIVNLNGGTINQVFQKNYSIGSVINLDVPTRNGYTFLGWTKSQGDAELNGNILKLFTESTTIDANWQSNESMLIVDLAGGTTTQVFDEMYRTGDTIELINPTRKGYTFTGWHVSNTNSILSGNTLTIGSNAITITATWEMDT